MAQSAFSTLKRPGSAVRQARPAAVNEEPSRPVCTSVARSVASSLSMPTVTAPANSSASRRPYGSSTFTIRTPGAAVKSSRLARKYFSIVGWKSRWSRVRFVNTAAAQWIASARCSSSAWEETSMTQAPSPPSSIRAKVACRSIASGVVRTAGSATPPDDLLDGAQEARAGPGRLEQRACQEARRRLAVGPGDADDREPRGRIAVQPRRDGRHRRAYVVDDDLGDAQAERSLNDERGGPLLDRLRREVMPVAGEPRDAEEEASRPDGARVVGERRHLDLGQRRALAVAQEVPQQHRPLRVPAAYDGGIRR